ncbi:MAG: LPXTG cell wall anchor domain-containing protein [Ilumatobacteraceae bacterium]
MRRKHMIMVFTGALGAAAALGGTAGASSYPPGGTTPVTAPSGGTTPVTPVDSVSQVVVHTGELPQTGSDSEAAAKIAAGALVAGVGLVVVARRRRRPSVA